MTTNNNNNSEQLTNACVIAYLNSINRRLGRINLSVGSEGRKGRICHRIETNNKKDMEKISLRQYAINSFLRTRSTWPQGREGFLWAQRCMKWNLAQLPLSTFPLIFFLFLLASNLWLSAHVSLKIYTQTCTHTHAHICIYINVKLACICVESMYKNVYIIRYMATRQ